MKALIFKDKIVQVSPVEFPVVPAMMWVDCPENCTTEWTITEDFSFIPPFPPQEPSIEEIRSQMVVTPLQFGKALGAIGMFQTVMDFVENSNDPIMKWAFNRALEFRRTDAFGEAAIVAMGKTPEEADNLFILAATL